MNDKLAEFRRVLDKCLARLAPDARPTVEVRDQYEPYSSPQLPVQAIIINGKYAAFAEMWGTVKEKMPSVRLEEIEPFIDPKHPRDDPARISNGPNPWSTCNILMQKLLDDWIYPIQREYHNYLFPKNK